MNLFKTKSDLKFRLCKLKEYEIKIFEKIFIKTNFQSQTTKGRSKIKKKKGSWLDKAWFKFASNKPRFGRKLKMHWKERHFCLNSRKIKSLISGFFLFKSREIISFSSCQDCNIRLKWFIK